MTIIIISLLLLVSLVPHLTFTAHVSIVNGNEAEPHSRPYMVSIQRNSQHICGGFLITEQFVLTAAHCLKKDEKLTVVVGAHNLKNKTEGSVHLNVTSYHRHKHYKYTPLKNDIMLLKLEKKVNLIKTVALISIPKKKDKKVINANTACSVAGWGTKETNGPTSDLLLEAKVKIMEDKNCQKLWNKNGLNSDLQYSVSKMMCTHGHGGSCNGDSGGPLVCENIAVGVTSFGNPDACNSAILPNVYTRISAYLDWIAKIIRKRVVVTGREVKEGLTHKAIRIAQRHQNLCCVFQHGFGNWIHSAFSKASETIALRLPPPKSACPRFPGTLRSRIKTSICPRHQNNHLQKSAVLLVPESTDFFFSKPKRAKSARFMLQDLQEDPTSSNHCINGRNINIPLCNPSRETLV
ncbi:granzyme-like protein 1 [Danio aesculapii]|uniref:granzyme-like protein 1 n=1 Tax=Danio aesculapii TaxID=1142201 RepID=UPI0024C032FF|nr:granzyme-like protein 1 [Danio aesculapii]